MTEKNRAPGYEGCPGCVAVDREGATCAPGNLAYCTALQGTRRQRKAGWVPGNCVGCLLRADGKACASGNATVCAVAWRANR